MNLRRLFFIHALITLAAGIVLIAAPKLIPETVDIQITEKQYLLCYFLGAAELGIAYLSFFSRKIEDKYALRLISASFIVFHMATALLEIYAFQHGISSKIIANIVVRIIVSGVFYYYGIHKNIELRT